MLAACSPRGIDVPLVTDKGIDVYRGSLSMQVKEFTPSELDAFNWAVADISFQRLIEIYPGATPREVIRAEVKKVKETYPPELEKEIANLPAYEETKTELLKLKGEGLGFSLPKNFFGLQPTVKVRLTNGTRFPISSLDWEVALFLDGADTPAATHRIFDNYKGTKDGMTPGYFYEKSFTIGFVSGNSDWQTLEIRNAKSYEVRVRPVLQSVKAFNEQVILPVSPERRMEKLRNAIQAAASFENI